MKTKAKPSVAKLQAELKVKDKRIAHLERVVGIWRDRYLKLKQSWNPGYRSLAREKP